LGKAQVINSRKGYDGARYLIKEISSLVDVLTKFKSSYEASIYGRPVRAISL